MFSTPKDRETIWTVNGREVGEISIFSEVPKTFIRACINALQASNFSFNVQFDGCGHDPGMAFIGERFYTFTLIEHPNSPGTLDNLAPVNKITYKEYENQKFVEKMLKEAINDFITDFDAWVDWTTMNPNADPAHVAAVKSNLSVLIELAEAAIKEKPYKKPSIYNAMFRNENAVLNSRW